MADNNKTFRELLGITTASNKTQTIANLIGGALFGGGVYGAFNTKTKDYYQATKDEQSRISEIGSAFGDKTEAQAKAFESDLSGYTQGAVEGAQSGLGARGITDSAVSKEVGQKTASGLSGAYAAARSALARAKANTVSQMDSTRAKYMQEIAGKQYQSQLKNYYDKMGIWGALGGAGTSLMELELGKSNKEKPIKENSKSVDYNNFIVSPKEATAPFTMKGVK